MTVFFVNPDLGVTEVFWIGRRIGRKRDSPVV
jgi:hypothetical protein